MEDSHPRRRCAASLRTYWTCTADGRPLKTKLSVRVSKLICCIAYYAAFLDTPQDLLFAPQELYRVPDMWRRSLQRPPQYQYEGYILTHLFDRDVDFCATHTARRRHVTRGRINFRRKGEHEFERYAKWRTEALEFVSDRILRDKERTRVASKV